MGKLQRIALFAIVGSILIYAGDYVLLRARGQALGSVDVQIMWAVKQKDNRIDYELGDSETRPCVHSLFPQMGYAPCWYLSRHKNQTITVGSVPRPAPELLKPCKLQSAFLRGAGTRAQCRIVSERIELCVNCGADPPVRSRPPGRLFQKKKSGTWASRADQGVRPT